MNKRCIWRKILYILQIQNGIFYRFKMSDPDVEASFRDFRPYCVALLARKIDETWKQSFPWSSANLIQGPKSICRLTWIGNWFFLFDINMVARHIDWKRLCLFNFYLWIFFIFIFYFHCPTDLTKLFFGSWRRFVKGIDRNDKKKIWPCRTVMQVWHSHVIVWHLESMVGRSGQFPIE